MTQVIQLEADHPDQDVIQRAASIIRNGGLVAFPTETVYGLGADAMNESAVRKIFEAKGRPNDNPLIVHVNRAMLDTVASDVPTKADLLIREFWPGPLTLVLMRKPDVAPSVSAGLPTVAVRMPDNEIALALIESSGTPLAAPSANASGKPSPTSAAHVLEDLNGRIDLVLDGGSTQIGIESTVLDVTVDPPVVLRPGWITWEQLADSIGNLRVAGSDEEVKRSPGTRHRHYRPRARVLLVESGSAESVEQLCRDFLMAGSVGFLGHSRINVDNPRLHTITLKDSADDYGREIYSGLRELDERGVDVIVIEGIDQSGEGAAVMDRLRRAASQVYD